MDRNLVADPLQFFRGEKGRLSLFNHVGDERKLQLAGNFLHPGHRLRRLDKQDIRTGLGIGDCPGDCVLQAGYRAGIRTGDNGKIGGFSRMDGSPYL